MTSPIKISQQLRSFKSNCNKSLKYTLKIHVNKCDTAKGQDDVVKHECSKNQQKLEPDKEQFCIT